MSRWLWALLGGVVLVAIATVFWTASNQTNVTPPVSPGPATVTPGLLLPRRSPKNPRPRQLLPCCAERRALASLCAPGREGGRSPARSRSDRAAPPTPAPDGDSKPPHRLLPRRPHDALRSARRRAGTFAAACSRSASRRAAAAARARTGGAGSRGHICAQESRAAGRGLGLFRGGLRQAFPAERQRLGLSAAGGQVRPGRDCRVAEKDPSAFRDLPIDGASNVEGALKVTAECADSISYTSRSTVIMLRSATELVYSASGDAVLATTLKKCTP